MSREKLACPSCKKVFGSIGVINATACSCRSCLTDYDVVGFPALDRSEEVLRAAELQAAEDSACFYHGENQAESVCEGCGRFLCKVCAVPYAGRTLCPSCIAAKRKQDAAIINERVVPGTTALTLALAPMILFPFWFFSCITAPLTLGFVLRNWKKPGSILPYGAQRGRMIAAAVIAILQLIAWTVGIVFFLTAGLRHASSF